MTPNDSRAIGRDMSKEPFRSLSLKNQQKIRNMCDSEIYTFEQYVIQRDKLSKNGIQVELSDRLKHFIENSKWTFAKTYADTWQHEYIVQEKVDTELFSELAQHIDDFGYESNFYQSIVVYFDYDGFTYWHMGNIINRCLYADTYQRREIDGRLPKKSKL